jgi:hypothetical protein
MTETGVAPSASAATWRRVGPVIITWNGLAYLFAVLWAGAASYFLFHIPFEFGETYGNLVQFVSTPPAHQVFIGTFASGGSWPQPGFLRTFSYASSKLLFDASAGHYFMTYRAFHAALMLLLMVCLIRLSRVGSPVTLALAMLSGMAVLGIHTFHEAVRETEFNIKLLVPVLCFGVVCLSASRPRWWKDLAAVAVTFYAVFSNELGLLLWVCVVAAYLVGFRGVSRWGVLATTAVFALYFFFRFVLWDVGAPSLVERSSGFGFRTLDPEELTARFESNPLPLYAYNIVASVLTVLFAEPRGGVFVSVRSALDGTISPGLWLEVASSVLTTAVMIWFVSRRVRAWLRWDFDYYDRLFVVSAAALAGNAVISYPYVKEVTMSTGGAFYALAMIGALRLLIANLAERPLMFWRGALICVLLAVISVSWTLRAASFYVDLSRFGVSVQRQWASTARPTAGDSASAAAESPVIARVRREMAELTVPPMSSAPRWLERLDPGH